MNGAGSAFVCIGRSKNNVPAIRAVARDQREKGMKISRRILMVATQLRLWLRQVPAMADLKFGVAAEPYAPFTSKDASGVWVGWEVDFMNAVCAEIGEKCTIEEVAWDGIIPALQASKFDVIMASMLITEKRKAIINFSNMYYDSAAVIIGPKGDDKDVSAEHLAGKTLGVQVSTAHARYMAKYYEPKGVVIKPMPRRTKPTPIWRRDGLTMSWPTERLLTLFWQRNKAAVARPRVRWN